jgi:hypothetical protein
MPAAFASADTLVDTGSGWYDNQTYDSGYFAFGFTASGGAQIDSFSMLAAATEAAVVGSSIDIYGNYPAAPTTPANLLGTLTYASMATEASRKRLTFTGSVAIPAAGDYWAKWRGLPDSSGIWILFGSPGTPAPWSYKAGPWYRNGTLQADLVSTYIPKFRITGTAIAAPTISSVSPATGTARGGTSVTITGTGLTGVVGVYFGGTAAASFAVNSATQITAVTPARAAGTTDVSVTTGGGTTALAEAFRFEPAVIDTAEGTVAATPAAQGAAPDRPRTSTVTPLSASRGLRPGIKTYSASIRTLRAGRYTIFFENDQGQRVPLQRGSRVGSRTLRTLIYAVVVNAGAGQPLVVSAALREAVTAGLRIRVIHRDDAGTLAGEASKDG